MPSKIQVDQIAGATGSTVTLPSGQTLDLSSGTVTLPNSAVNLTTKVTGTLPVANGGTGITALGTASQVLRVNSGATGLEFGTVSTKLLGHKITVDQTGINLGNVNRSISYISQLATTYTTISSTSYFVIRATAHGMSDNHQKFAIEWSKDNSNWYHTSQAGNAGFSASAYTPTGSGITWSSALVYQYPQMSVTTDADPNRNAPATCQLTLRPTTSHSASTIYLRIGSFVTNGSTAFYNINSGNSTNDGTICTSSLEITEFAL